jgi:pre-mycofactocin synthase
VGLSSFGSKSVEQVATANSETFFQVYWVGGLCAGDNKRPHTRAGAREATVRLKRYS